MPDDDPDLEAIPEKHAMGIALAIMVWSDLEFEIDYTIWDLMDAPQALSACLTAQLISPIPKLNALLSLLRLYEFGENLEDRLSQFSGNIGGLVERRNRIVHDKRIWDPQTGDVSRINVTARGRLKFGKQPESLDDLMDFAKSVMAARTKFLKIRDEIIQRRDAFKALPADKKPQLPRLVREVLSDDGS
jgi:hypothetical protein